MEFAEGLILKKLYTYLLLALLAVFIQPAWAGKAINFSLTDTKGKVHRLSDFKGKWVLVNFWAPWCPRCRMEFPLLNDLDSRKDVVVLGVVMDYGIDEASAHTAIARNNLRYPQALAGNRKDPNSPAHQVGPVDFYPTSYLYAPDGELVMFIPGVVSENRLTAFMHTYAQENPTALATVEPLPAPVAQQPATVAPQSSAAKPANYKKPAPKSQAKKKINRA
jgi:thiol-disulfide isomerase/thioredoxin